MSSNKNTKPETQPKDKSDNQILKEGGYSGMKNMMDSYGLKLSNDDDVQEAKAIIEGFRAVDQQQSNAGKQEPKGGK